MKKYIKILIPVSILIIIVGFFLFQIEKPNSFNGLLRQGEAYVKEGKIATALEHYNRLVRLYPQSYELHLRVGNLYEQVNEHDKAKIEYYRAINLKNTNKYDAHFAMANLYALENNYTFAQEILMTIKDVPSKKVLEGIGDFYYNWGEKISKIDLFDAIRKYKTAYNFYKDAKSKNINKTKLILEKTYDKVAEKLIVANNIQEAIKILNLSIEFVDNPTAHYKLAKIYTGKNIDKAINEYEKTLNLNPKAFNHNELVNLLIKKVEILKQQKDETTAKYYYDKAKKLNPSINIPYIPDENILVNLIATKCSESIEKDTLIPGVSFKIINISKEKIDYLKVKVVFLENEKPYSEKIEIIATPKKFLNPNTTTSNINLFSQKPLQHVFDSHNIKIQIFVSQKNPDKWKLYRNAYFVRKRDSKIILNYN
ncbi:MAG: tetratricopeptide repeat protein [bacterium]